jgi:hypothetical protein
VQVQGLSALAYLAGNDHFEDAVVEEGGVAVLLAAMKNHPGDVEVQVRGFPALHPQRLQVFLSSATAPRRDPLLACRVQSFWCCCCCALCSLLETPRHYHPCQRVACCLLRDLSGNSALRDAIVAGHGVQAVVTAMERSPRSAPLQEVRPPTSPIATTPCCCLCCQ